MIPVANYEKLENHKDSYKKLFEQLARYRDIHLEMYPKSMDLDTRFRHLERDFSEDTKEIGQYYNQETLSLLEHELGSITDTDFVLGVRLKMNLLEESEDMQGMVKNAFASVTDSIVNWFGLDRELTDEFFDRFKGVEQELFEQVMRVEGQRLSEDHLIYINRYNFIRDIHHSVEEEKQKRGVTNITDSILDPTEMGFLKLQTTEGQSYISFVVVDEFPADLAYTHLYQKAQNLPFPVELHMKAKYKDKDQTLRKIGFAKQRFKETDKDMAEAGEDLDDKLVFNNQALNSLQTGVRGNEEAFMEWVSAFVVYGQSKAECKQRANHLISQLKDQEVYCVRPIADQLTLFYKFLHGEPLKLEKNWVQQTTHTAFAENLFGVSNRLGSNMGFYFGRVAKGTGQTHLEQSVASSRDIVLFHPFIANEGIAGASTDSPHISITGQTGKGKSFLVKLILFYLSFLKTNVLITDPKNEIEENFTKAIEDPEVRMNYPLFTELIQSIHYVTLDPHNSANHGVLDPICFLEGYEAKDNAQGIIEQIYDMNGKDDVKTELLKTLSDVIEERAQGKQRGMMHVVQRLQASESKNVKNAGDLLYQIVQNSILQLVFSDGSYEGVSLHNKINVLQIQGLDLPHETDDPAFYSDSERKSLCVMLPLAKFCEKFGSRSKKEKTAIIFDEAWMLTKARGGKKLIKQMRRIGRSYSNQLYLVTQSVRDVENDDDVGNFGAKFAFDEEAERDEILDFMNLENVEENQKLLKNMTKGHCLFKDFYGRTGKLAIDCLFDEWKEAFKTVDQSYSAKAEEEIL